MILQSYWPLNPYKILKYSCIDNFVSLYWNDFKLSTIVDNNVDSVSKLYRHFMTTSFYDVMTGLLIF